MRGKDEKHLLEMKICKQLRHHFSRPIDWIAGCIPKSNKYGTQEAALSPKLSAGPKVSKAYLCNSMVSTGSDLCELPLLVRQKKQETDPEHTKTMHWIATT